VYGIQSVVHDPVEAVRAFYWASRIDPSSGDALYALRAAKMLAMNSDEFNAYMNWHGAKRTSQQLALDSLIYRAYLIDPFTFGNLDAEIMRREIAEELRKGNPKIDAGELAYMVGIGLHSYANRAWFASTEGRFADALAMYAEMLAAKPFPYKKKSDAERAARFHEAAVIQIHAARGRIFFMLDSLDSARAEISTAVEGMRARESNDDILLYESKAMFLQALGMIEERAQHLDRARDAYGAALQEDLSFFAAHSHLARLDLVQGDTAAALTEMDLAVQLQPDDPALRFRYAEVLVRARHDADAAAQLRKAIALDPWYGAPHLLMARIADVEQYTDDAIAEYRTFVGIASKTDHQLIIARNRLAALTAIASSQAR
jgi:tetratricopeptide (TPR) repeat protein